MAGERSKRRVPTKHYQDAVRELADSLGWRERDVFHQFQHLSWMLEFEMPCERNLAEWIAFRYTRLIFDKRGIQPS